MDATFEEVVKLVEQLDTDQQNLLIYRLRVKQMKQRTMPHKSQPQPHEYSGASLAQRGTEYIESYRSPTREELIQDAEILRNTPVHPGEQLLGKYANPHVPDITEEEFHAQMHAISTEWEQELNDLANDNT